MQTNRMDSLWHVCNLNKSFIFIHNYKAHWNGRAEKWNAYVQYFPYGYWSYAPPRTTNSRRKFVSAPAKDHRSVCPLENATINRILALLRRGMNVARKNGLIWAVSAQLAGYCDKLG